MGLSLSDPDFYGDEKLLGSNPLFSLLNVDVDYLIVHHKFYIQNVLWHIESKYKN